MKVVWFIHLETTPVVAGPLWYTAN